MEKMRMLPALLVVFLFIMIGWGVISSMTAPKTGHKRRGHAGDGGSPFTYADSSDGGCDAGGDGGD